MSASTAPFDRLAATLPFASLKQRVVLDLAQHPELRSADLRAILRWHVSLRASNVDVAIASSQATATDMLCISGISDVMDVYPSIEDAASALTKRRRRTFREAKGIVEVVVEELVDVEPRIRFAKQVFRNELKTDWESWIASITVGGATAIFSEDPVHTGTAFVIAGQKIAADVVRALLKSRIAEDIEVVHTRVVKAHVDPADPLSHERQAYWDALIEGRVFEAGIRGRALVEGLGEHPRSFQ